MLTIHSLSRLSKRLKELQEKAHEEDPTPILTFDKDDVDTLDFVAATANLRATTFHIENKSKFDIKRGLNRTRSSWHHAANDSQKWLAISFPQLLQQMQ